MEKEEITTNDYLKGIVLNLPDSPGIYQYLNSEGTIIYVGKAKNLKRRVSSYFNREHPNGKTRLLVSKIADIRYIVVKTEEDALLLENNLIKKYKPRYNVLLKDDKTYPSICVSNEYFPRIFKNPASHPQRVLLLWSVQSHALHACRDGLDQKALPHPYLQTQSKSRKHSRRQVQRMSGISHKELQRALHRAAVTRGIHEEYR